MNQAGTADVTLAGLEFSGLRTNALAVGGSGTGELTVRDSSFVGNRAEVAAALYFTRSSAEASTAITNSTFDSNIGTTADPLAVRCGAVRFEAGSAGTVRITNSAFVDNQLVEGIVQPRGGAIAMHDSNVQLYLDQDNFARNSTSTTSPVGTAQEDSDGGAVSSVNSTADTNGSIFVSNSTFEANRAGDDGAALFIEGRSATIASTYPTRLEVENSTFIGNISGGFETDSGGAIQASLRAEVALTHNTFVGNTKSGNRGGVDVGARTDSDLTYGNQSPVISSVNNIFTKASSVDTNHTSCASNVGCDNNTSTIAAGDEAQVLLDVFGAANPNATVNGTTRITGDTRDGRTGYPLTTVQIAPPLVEDATTAYLAGTGATSLISDQRGVAFKAIPDAGSLEMDFVRFDAQTNGGSWSGLTATFPTTGDSYFADDTASTGWYEIADPGGTVSFTAAPTPPTGTSFTGWFTAAAGGTAVTAATAGGQTLYAQFTVLTYTVTFDTDGGSEVAPITGIPHGDAIERPDDPTLAGFDFVGWYSSTDGSWTWFDFTTPITEDLTLCGMWEWPQPSIQVDDVTYTYGDVPTLRATVRGIGDGLPLAFTILDTPDGDVEVGDAMIVDGVAAIAPSAHLGLDVGDYEVEVSCTIANSCIGQPMLYSNNVETGNARSSADVSVRLLFDGYRASGTLTVEQAPTVTTLTATVTSAKDTEAVVLQFGDVTAQFDTISTGTVTIMAGDQPLSAAQQLDADGNYTGTIAIPYSAFDAEGDLTLVALHSGDLNHLPSEAQAEIRVEFTSDVRATDTTGGGAVLSSSLPVTGTGMTLPILMLATLLLLIGSGTAWWVRRPVVED